MCVCVCVSEFVCSVEDWKCDPRAWSSMCATQSANVCVDSILQGEL